jgi:hypothetical protein
MSFTNVGGTHAVGKSHAMRLFLMESGAGNVQTTHEYGVPLTLHTIGKVGETPAVVVLGNYDFADPRRVWPGTDRLPFHAQPAAKRAVEDLVAKGVHVVCEGDRLFNGSMKTFLEQQGIPHTFVVMEAPVDVLEQQRARRVEDVEEERRRAKTARQRAIKVSSERSVKSRVTKIEGMKKAFGDVVCESQAHVADRLRRLLNGS